MGEVKVSLICTLKNEESSINEFLDSLLAQSRPPDEIVIVDGGSTDKTVEIIKSYIEEGAPIKLIVADGANIAEGRNIAIKNAKYDIIASTDAGCRIDKDWLKNIIKPFEKDTRVDVVSGWYEADIDAGSVFQTCVAEVRYPKKDRIIADTFLPSGRSIAFKRGAWEKVGGYPKWLYTGEDTWFDLQLKKLGFKFALAQDAIVYWPTRSNLKGIFKQQYLYSKGDGQAKQFTMVYFKYFIIYLMGLIILLFSFFQFYFIFPLIFFASLYLLQTAKESYKKNKSIKTFLCIPLINLMIDLGRIIGFFVGSLDLKLNKGFKKYDAKNENMRIIK